MKTKVSDVIKAMRKGSRDEEMSILGPGFHAKTKIHKTKKQYDRKKLKKDLSFV